MIPLFCSLVVCAKRVSSMNGELEALELHVKELVLPVLSGRRVDLVELLCRNVGGGVLLRFLVDTPRGINVSELSSVNQAIGALLEEHNVVPSAYTLEVSSPGLDRPLKTQSDFERVIGRRVRVATAVPVGFKREHVGQVLNVNDETVVLKSDQGEKIRIPLSDIAHAVQEIEL